MKKGVKLSELKYRWDNKKKKLKKKEKNEERC